MAISFVDNHDTQPLQSLQSPVEQWFKPIAYALILLREQGIPCVFYPALYAAKYVEKNSQGEEVYIQLDKIDLVATMMKVRNLVAYGTQRDYFDNPNVIGWTRQEGCAVLVSNAGDGEKYMSMGTENAGKILIDCSRSVPGEVILNENGEGLFKVKGGSVSIWIDKQAARHI